MSGGNNEQSPESLERGTAGQAIHDIDRTSCIEQTPPNPWVRLILAHGAGAPMDSVFMNQMCERLLAHGVALVRFEFPYMMRRRILQRPLPPDRQRVLLDTWQRVVALYRVKAQKREKALPLFIGGKSMGGRMATVWAAQQSTPGVAGLVCLGYPFHPSGRPERLRIGHLSDLQVPALVVQGTRDRLGNKQEVADYELGKQVRLHWIAGGDHDLKPLKQGGMTHARALDDAAQAACNFMQSVL